MSEDDKILVGLIGNPNELISTEKTIERSDNEPPKKSYITPKSGGIYTLEPSELAKKPMPQKAQSSNSSLNER